MRKFHLNARIKRKNSLGLYEIIIDGDVFTAKTYKDAVKKLINIILRDEL